MGYFKEGSEIRVRNKQLHDELSGTQNFYIVLDAGREGGFKEAENLQRVYDIQRFIEKTGRFDTSLSPADFVAMIHREMSGGDPGKYRVPGRNDLIAQYLLFFTRSDLDRYVSPGYSQANIHVRHNISSSYELEEALKGVRSFIETAVGERLTYQITGEGILYNKAADTMATGQVYSLSLILVLVFLVMTILFVRVKAGLLALIPNAIPIFFLFGVMGFFGIPLNPGTVLVAVCAIGIAVDDTIHIFVRYNNEMKRFNDQKLAVVETIRGDLRPVLITTVALALGFGVLGFSSFIPTMQFGLLAAMVMMCALSVDLLVTPILLSTTKLITVWDLLGMHLTEEVVKRSELFQGMTPMQIKKIVLLGHIRDLAADDYIVRQGERERTMYMILEGAARVELETEGGARANLRELSEGEIFGEIALVNEVGRTASVIANRATKVLSLDWDSLERIRKIFPRISTRFFLNISRVLGTRLADTSEQLAEAFRSSS